MTSIELFSNAGSASAALVGVETLGFGVLPAPVAFGSRQAARG